ncbi:hypothetical protein G7Z17_g398 [Cylindrodendrum hubeiense]|uniref:Uncharacterized protein n=1 Tax=Cylindrodendrum hubeiense TaxID=595255 RepID=A0A9P5HPQ5_9HYPO|nr:hypothetical protein G7Z17_g398 [Cylindrodendrum hubeiense]
MRTSNGVTRYTETNSHVLVAYHVLEVNLGVLPVWQLFLGFPILGSAKSVPFGTMRRIACNFCRPFQTPSPAQLSQASPNLSVGNGANTQSPAAYQLNQETLGLDFGRGRPEDVLREGEFTHSLMLLYFSNFSDVHFMFDEELFLKDFAVGQVPKIILYSIMALSIRDLGPLGEDQVGPSVEELTRECHQHSSAVVAIVRFTWEHSGFDLHNFSIGKILTLATVVNTHALLSAPSTEAVDRLRAEAATLLACIRRVKHHTRMFIWVVAVLASDRFLSLRIPHLKEYTPRPVRQWRHPNSPAPNTKMQA